MPLAWATDLHLDTLGWATRDKREPKVKIKAFCDKLRYAEASTDGLLITGDIADGHPTDDWFAILKTAYRKPIYFVLGNHDYYNGGIDITTSRVRRYSKTLGGLHWLNDTDGVELSGSTMLIGHDGWYCGTEGDGIESKLCKVAHSVPLADMTPTGISELYMAAMYGMPRLFDLMAAFAKVSSDVIGSRARTAAAQGFQRVLIATHVPPFWEASFYKKKKGPAHTAPFYVNKILGDGLLAVAAEHPDVEFVVYCGHAHDAREYEAAPNLTVKTGKARCGWVPSLQVPIEV